MGPPKRKLANAATSVSSAVEDKTTDIVDNLKIEDDEDDDSDSSAYSELEDEEEEEDDDSDDEGDESEDEDDDDEEDDDDSDDEEEEEESEKDDESEKENEVGGKKTTVAAEKKIQKAPEAPVAGGSGVDKEEGGGGAVESPAVAAATDEYEYDSSDEEDIRNTIGNIPTNWYDDYEHLGYDLDGRQIRKPKRGDELDHFLRRMEDGNAGITVQDPTTGQDVVLSAKEVDSIRRITKGKVPVSNYNLYEDLVDWFSSETMETPVRDLPDSKRSFLPSLSEKRKVGKMVHAIKMGWMKTRAQREEQQAKEDGEAAAGKRFYLLWQSDDRPEEMRRINDTIPAPKMKLPGHAESYNPPPEYLFSERERKTWEELDEEPYKRKLQFVPAKYDSLRKVPAYAKFINERFERCLDLYLAPRARKMRLTIQPEDLVPALPKPKDLQPFPTACALTYKGHVNMIRTISIDPSGQFLASGSDDGTVKIWEVQTGYCMKTFSFGAKVVVRGVTWCPNKALSLLAVALESQVLLINAGVGDKLVVEQTEELLRDAPADTATVQPPERVRTAVTWSLPEDKSVGSDRADAINIKYPKGTLVVLKFFRQVKQVTWHGKGDYFATVLTDAQNRSVLVHQLSKWRSQVPFSKSKGLVQCVLFHPIRPYLFVATQRHVRIYNLSKQEMSKKLQTGGAKWISSLAVHPKGDNVLVGTYDKRVQWFDLDLSTLPYQVLRYHATAVRQVAFHKRYPLFASGADDTSIIVSHGMVYNDLLQNPLIVPVKLLRGHAKYDDFGVMDVAWHPTQPWLFSAGADGYVKLWA